MSGRLGHGSRELRSRELRSRELRNRELPSHFTRIRGAGIRAVRDRDPIRVQGREVPAPGDLVRETVVPETSRRAIPVRVIPKARILVLLRDTSPLCCRANRFRSTAIVPWRLFRLSQKPKSQRLFRAGSRRMSRNLPSKPSPSTFRLSPKLWRCRARKRRCVRWRRRPTYSLPPCMKWKRKKRTMTTRRKKPTKTITKRRTKRKTTTMRWRLKKSRITRNSKLRNGT